MSSSAGSKSKMSIKSFFSKPKSEPEESENNPKSHNSSTNGEGKMEKEEANTAPMHLEENESSDDEEDSQTSKVTRKRLRKNKQESGPRSTHPKKSKVQAESESPERASQKFLNFFGQPKSSTQASQEGNTNKQTSRPKDAGQTSKVQEPQRKTKPLSKSKVKGNVNAQHLHSFDATESDWKMGDSVPYHALTEVFAKIDATTKRLEIQNHLTEFFRSVISLSPTDLVACCFLASNQLAASFECIEIGIGDALLIKAVSEATGRQAKDVKKQYEMVGDLGSVAQQSRGKQRTLGFAVKPKPLTVVGVLKGLKSIAGISGNNSQTNKVNYIKKMLVACKGNEAKYIIRQLQGKLRIGLAESSVHVALAHAFVLSPAKSDHPQPPKSDQKLSEAFEQAVIKLKQVFSECPTYDKVVPALLDVGLADVQSVCFLTPGIPVAPMLAKPTKGIGEVLDRFNGVKFTCEYKYDGERAQIHRLPDGSIKIFSRNSENTTERFPDVIASIKDAFDENSVKTFVLDCEVIAWSKEKQELLPFQILSTRSRKATKIEDIKVPVILMAFDLLYLNDKSLLQSMLCERRSLLHSSFKPVEHVFKFAQYKEGTEEDELQSFLEQAVKDKTEGLMVKTLEQDATYEPSRRSLNWLKLKKDYMAGMTDSLDLVPIGGYWGKGKRTGVFGCFLLACYDPDTENYQTVCKIGTGFSEENLNEFTKFFQDDHIIPKPPSNYIFDEGLKCDVWFNTCVTWEVQCADLSISPVHKGAIGKKDPNKGIGLRFPRFLRIRTDKDPENATTSSQVAEMYSNQDSVEKVDEDDDDDFI